MKHVRRLDVELEDRLTCQHKARVVNLGIEPKDWTLRQGDRKLQESTCRLDNILKERMMCQRIRRASDESMICRTKDSCFVIICLDRSRF